MSELSVLEARRSSTDATDESTWSRSCTVCTTVKQTHEFGRNEYGGWYTMCPKCRQTRGIRERVQKMDQEKDARLKDGLNRLVGVARSKANPLPDMAEICSEMIRQFGGVAEFCLKWHAQISAAKDGSKTKLDQFYTIFKMIKSTSEDQREEINWSTVTPEDLESALEDYVLKVLHPDDEDEPETQEHDAQHSA